MKNKLNSKILSFIFIMAIFSLSFCCVEVVYAKEDYSITTCKYSEAYLEWEKLSDEEKKNSIQPPMCDTSLTSTNRLQSNVRESFNAFNRTKLPTKYDNRGTEREAIIKDQMNTGQCWAFATTTALEIFTKISLGLDMVYSPRHIEYATSRVFKDDKINDWGFNREVGSGGHVFFSSGYLMGHVGPVLEEDMPFENNEDVIDISEIDKEPVLDVNGLTIGGLNDYAPCTGTVINDMKNKIYEKGSIVSSMYYTSSSYYFNSATSAFYYNGGSAANHSITIVGWDDNYAVTNFSSSNRPSSPGAWIIHNSWGTGVGESGYNYISYSDERICTIYMSIDDVDTEIEDNAYIYDKLGHNISLGYKSNLTGESLSSGYGMAVYNKSNKTELLKEVTIGTADVGTYKIYYAEGDASSITDISQMTLIGEGNTTGYGYLTHKLENPLLIGSDVSKFSIAVHWDLTNNYVPIPILRTTDADYIYMNAESGQTYISYLGDYWQDVASSQYIVSIKAFTDNVDYSFDALVGSVAKGTNDVVNVTLDLETNNVVKEKINMTVTDKNDNFIDDVEVTYQLGNSNELIGANLKFSNGLKNGIYYINIYYDNNFITTLDFIVKFGMYSDVYEIDDDEQTIYVYSSVELNAFLSNLEGYRGKVLKDGTEVTSGYIGTGMMIDDYIIILRGDVTGDGLVKVNDVMKISKYTVEGTGLENRCFMKAADVTNDSLVKVNDVMKISKYTVEGGTL